ncbi:ryanodine receptor 1 [Platysternon megacephalum]|uniref:Ryanodine receptor 1 n=1 Tax=Platysternon megacephalum TaxID=55544 RepID=A0A4D9DUH6_9SAUR|nr:ryanodine receptor 1 [Platysternon megacephalum]
MQRDHWILCVQTPLDPPHRDPAASHLIPYAQTRLSVHRPRHTPSGILHAQTLQVPQCVRMLLVDPVHRDPAFPHWLPRVQICRICCAQMLGDVLGSGSSHFSLIS